MAVVVFTFVLVGRLASGRRSDGGANTRTQLPAIGMVYVALTIGLIVMVLPFLWMVLSSI